MELSGKKVQTAKMARTMTKGDAVTGYVVE
jgi:hypothetical protein